jgi:Putative zinc-finger
MSPLDGEPRDRARHQEVWELLPWFVNGTLEARDRDAVTAHVAACAACGAELERCRSLETIVKGAAEHRDWAPSAAHLASVWRRIDASAATRSNRPSALAGVWRRWRERFAIAPPAIRWALAVQSVLVLALGATVAWRLAWPVVEYRTLSSPPASAPSAALIRVVFADDVTLRELRALLGGLEASVVAGPSPTGVYTIGVPGPAAVAPALETLRAHAQVRLAEPIAPSR